MNREIRAGAPVEIREDENGLVKVEGYAAVFNQETNIGGMFREKIEAGAFKDAVGRDDVVFLVNHDGLPLARTRSGTLELKEDKHGLFISTELDSSDPDVQQIIPKMKRGDMDKMSFAFMSDVEEWDDASEIPLRTVKEARLFDVSIVNNPAYEGTEIGLRSLEQHRSENKGDFSNVKMKMRMKLALAKGA